MSQATKPTSSDQTNEPPREQALPEAELEKVTGGATDGKVVISDIKIIKHYDKSSPSLG